MEDHFENLGPAGQIASQMEITNFAPGVDEKTGEGVVRVVASCARCLAEQRIDVSLADIVACGALAPESIATLREDLKTKGVGEVVTRLCKYNKELVLWVGARCNAEGAMGQSACGGFIEAIDEVDRVKSVMARAKRMGRR